MLPSIHVRCVKAKYLGCLAPQPLPQKVELALPPPLSSSLSLSSPRLHTTSNSPPACRRSGAQSRLSSLSPLPHPRGCCATWLGSPPHHNTPPLSRRCPKVGQSANLFVANQARLLPVPFEQGQQHFQKRRHD